MLQIILILPKGNCCYLFLFSPVLFKWYLGVFNCYIPQYSLHMFRANSGQTNFVHWQCTLHWILSKCNAHTKCEHDPLSAYSLFILYICSSFLVKMKLEKMYSPIKSGDGFFRVNQNPLNIGKDSSSLDNINV